jgi:choline-sulfatase
MSRASIVVASSIAIAACSKSAPPAPAEPSPSAAPTVSAAPDAATTSAEVPAGPWNVVMISIDSLRADMPWAGYDRPIAPRLTELHAKSTSYTRAYSTSSFTSKSVPGMLTGRYPSELTRTGSFFTVYPQKKEFMCTWLAAEDVPCIGAHAHMYFAKGNSGFDNGFKEWKIVPGLTFDYQMDPYVTSDKLTPLAIEMLGGVTARPFFAWFHYMDPHDEYKGHTESPHFGKRPRDLYDEEVFFTDLWVGKLLDFIESQPWAARTVIAVTADHGEAFGEHGLTRHAHEIFEMLVHVPLFFYVPGQKARTIDVPRSAVDLVPTFLELLGKKAPEEAAEKLAGKSLAAEIRGAAAEPRDVIVDLPEDDHNERRRALVHEKWKLIAYGDDARFSLYDLEADPKEETDIFWKQKDVGEDMRQRYKRIGKSIKDVPPSGGIPGKRDR